MCSTASPPHRPISPDRPGCSALVRTWYMVVKSQAVVASVCAVVHALVVDLASWTSHSWWSGQWTGQLSIHVLQLQPLTLTSVGCRARQCHPSTWRGYHIHLANIVALFRLIPQRPVHCEVSQQLIQAVG